MEAGENPLALVQAVEHLGPAPVGQPGVEFHLAQHAGGRVVAQHPAPLQQGLGGDAQAAGALLQEDFHVGAVAGQQGHVHRQLGEAHLDVDGARLLLQLAHEGCDAADLAMEMAAAKGVQADPHLHADAHPAGIHLVDRRIDVEAAVVDQVHRRRRRNARR